MRRVDSAKSQPTTYAMLRHQCQDHTDETMQETQRQRCQRAAALRALLDLGLAVIDQAARLSPCADWARLMDAHAGTRGVQIKQTE